MPKNRNLKPASYCILLLSLFFTDSSFALRCGRFIISPGEYKNEVYNKCGEPDSVESHVERRGSQNSTVFRQNNNNEGIYYPNNSFSYGQTNYAETDVIVEEWIYNFGSSRFQQYLRFENGKLLQIQDLGKGHPKRQR